MSTKNIKKILKFWTSSYSSCPSQAFVKFPHLIFLVSLAILIKIYVFGNLFKINLTVQEVVFWFFALFLLFYSFGRSTKWDDYYNMKMWGFILVYISTIVTVMTHQFSFTQFKGFSSDSSILVLRGNFLQNFSFFSRIYLQSRLLLSFSSIFLNYVLILKFPWETCKYLNLTCFEESKSTQLMIILLTFFTGVSLQLSQIQFFKPFLWGTVGINSVWMYFLLFSLSRGIDHSNNTEYWIYNGISSICFIIVLYIGTSKKRMNFLRDISIIFLVLFMIQKGMEFPWRNGENAIILFGISIVGIIFLLFYKKMKQKEE
jgi:hypothetical protein